MREQIERLENHADLGANFLDPLVLIDNQLSIAHKPIDRFAFDADRTAVERFQMINAAKHGRLAGAGRADDADHLALCDLERDITQDGDGTEGFAYFFQPDHRGVLPAAAWARNRAGLRR
jgi:hypothetical protein